jgi:hypothetical protein
MKHVTVRYYAKERAYNAQFFERAMNVRAAERQSLENDSKYAIDWQHSSCTTNR